MSLSPFLILGQYSFALIQNVACYYFLDHNVMNEILSSAPDQMIKFKVFKRNPLTKQYNIDSRLTLVINRTKLPFGVWANLVVESIH